jgi:plastocyanin
MYLRAIVFVSAILLLSSCGDNSPTNPSPNPNPNPSGPSVSIVMGASGLTTTAFSPNPLTVSAGATVTWVNNDSISHTATSNAGGTFDTGVIAPGGQVSKQFMSAGSFPYHCSIHPGMIATITVQ